MEEKRAADYVLAAHGEAPQDNSVEGFVGQLTRPSSETLYFVSLMKNKIETKVKRGSLVKALAIGSRYRFLDCFKRVLLRALNAYFEVYNDEDPIETNVARAYAIVEDVYGAINAKHSPT